MNQKILDKVIKKYIESDDFNGYPVSCLKKQFGLNNEKAKTVIHDLIKSRHIDVMFGDIHPNAHIKAFSDTTAEKQIDTLKELEFSEDFCLYPSKETLAKTKSLNDYSQEPYRKQLATGCGQFDFCVFDLSVLECYRNDPRYYYQVNFISGKISVTNEHFESKSMAEHDKIVLETFGFAYDKDLNRAVAVFLRYLYRLSPEHQQRWKGKELSGSYHLNPDYLNNSMGYWTQLKMPIFEAFNKEMITINEMAQLIGKPPLFKNTYQNNDYDKSFGFLLRPTQFAFNDFVLLLDKLMSDNLNHDFFNQDLDLKEDHLRKDGKVEVIKKGTIVLLREWLNLYFNPKDPEPLELMLSTFKKVRKLRQKPAHSIQEDEFNQKYLKDQRLLIDEAYDAVRTLRLVLAGHPEVKKSPPEIDEFRLKYKIWKI